MIKTSIYLGVIFSLVLAPVVLAAPADGTGPWADSVISFTQGLRKDGTPVLPDRTDPTDALGVAESTGVPFDNPVVAGSFFSLGFGGIITLGFNNAILNGTGNDLKVYEVTGGTTYPEEKVKVEASYDGTNWLVLANEITRDSEVDLGNLVCAQYIRVTDVSNPAIFEAVADGYDLDGVKALNYRSTPCNLMVDISKTASSYEVSPGEIVTYTYTLTNPGDFNLSNVAVADDYCLPLSGPTGDNGNNLLEPAETWIYTCAMALSVTTTNTATVTAQDQFGTGVTDQSSITVAVSEPGCTLTQGYWKTHSINGPAPYDDTWNGLEDDPFYSSSQSYYQVLWTSPSGGNAYYNLAHQYIAAHLNMETGATVPTAVLATYNTATSLFGLYTPTYIGGLKGNNSLRQQFLSLAGILGNYNEGVTGPGHCSE